MQQHSSNTGGEDGGVRGRALALQYWREQVKGMPATLALPTLRGTSWPGDADHSTHSFAWHLERGSTAGGATSADEPQLVFFCAALSILLLRYCDQDDITIGLKSRQWPEILPLRVRLARTDPFLDLVQRVARTLDDAVANRGPSLSDISAMTHDYGRSSAEPLIRVALAVDDVWPGDRVDVAIRLMSGTGRWSGEIRYNSALFDAESISRFADHLETLAAAALDDAAAPIGQMPLLTVQETTQILFDWNRTDVDLGTRLRVHELFEAQVSRNPDAPAVLAAGEVISYRSLDESANVVAQALLGTGARRGDAVGIFIRRSVEAISAILGVLKAGCTYVPMDPAYPRTRLAFMLEDAGLHMLLTRRQERDELTAADDLIILQMDQLSTLDRQPRYEQPAEGQIEDELCYILYTSGSTGKPKGIELRHRGVSNNIADLNQRFRVGPGDRILAVSSLSFDMSVYEILGTLAAGATIVVPDPERLHDPEYLADQIEQHGVTTWSSAPPLFAMMLDALNDREDIRLRSLRLAMLSGDWVPVAMPDQIRAFAPQCRVVVLGGATEASIYSTIYEVAVVDPAWKSIPYGRPMANQRVYVLDAERQPVPMGVPGELYIGGVGLARGYHGQPALTAERFLDDPFLPGERVYRTGDRVRFLPDGNLQLLGRLDLQVKVRGFRIELGEIEHAFESDGDVRNAVVVVREDAPGEPRLVAYVLSRRADVEPAALLARIAAVLPHYMVPAAVVVLSEFPLTPNGKVDRKSLPLPERESSARPPFAAPSSDVERTLLSCWEEVLRVGRIGVHDNFFSLGGDSITCIQLVTRARRAGLSCGPNDVFKWPTVAQLSKVLTANDQ